MAIGALSNSSALLRLPQELRDLIYTCLFKSTRITFGYILKIHPEAWQMVLPARHSLAILRVCRQIHHEVGCMWLGLVLFNFEDNMTLLDKLSPLSHTKLGMIRNIRTQSISIEPFPPLEMDDNLPQQGLLSLFKLLPALRLDRLIIVGANLRYLDRHTIEEVLRYDNGWKELRFVSQESCFLTEPSIEELGGRNTDYHSKCRSQLRKWVDVLSQGQGPQFRATATVYQSSPKDSHHREVLRVSLARIRKQNVEMIEPTEALIEPGCKWIGNTTGFIARLETLMVIKRVLGPSSPHDSPSQSLLENFRDWAQGRSWRAIKSDFNKRTPEEHKEDGGNVLWYLKGVEESLQGSDLYDDVDDLNWDDRHERY